SAKRPVHPDGHDAGRRPQHRISEGSRRRQGAHGAQRRQDQRNAGRGGAARPGALQPRRRVRGIDAQSRAGTEDHDGCGRAGGSGGRAAWTLGCRRSTRGRRCGGPGRCRRRRPSARRRAADRARCARGGEGGGQERGSGWQCSAGGQHADRSVGPGLSTHAARQRAHQMRFARAQCDAEGGRPRRRSSIGSENRTVPDRAPGTTTMINRLSAPGMLLAAIVLLTGCATTYHPDRGMETLPSAPLKSAASIGDATTPPRGPLPEGTETTKVFKGTGILVKGQQPGGALPAAVPGAVSNGPSVTLNFEGAELREVIRNILTDILGESYTIDPAVGGTVTIRTTSGIPREALPATLEMILRSNGATMIKEGTIWKVVPAATAVRGNITPQLGNSSRAIPPGFGVQIVPLKYVGVRQMMAILEPFQKDATTIRADDLRNLLIISGTELELRRSEE